MLCFCTSTRRLNNKKNKKTPNCTHCVFEMLNFEQTNQIQSDCHMMKLLWSGDDRNVSKFHLVLFCWKTKGSQLACKELDESPSIEDQSGFNSGMDTRLLSGAEGASHQPSDIGVGEWSENTMAAFTAVPCSSFFLFKHIQYKLYIFFLSRPESCLQVPEKN